MPSLCQSDSTIINCVRVKADHAGAVNARQRIERLLRGATLRPSRLPPSAILFVRRLRDATPVSRISDSNRSQVAEWERSLNDQLDRLVAVAVRAADYPVPASAEAVVFAERAEMLACLASDWLKGSLRTNWWWSSLFSSGGADSLLAREWLASPEFVPLALEHLANRSQAVALAARISDDLAATLLSRVVHVFGISMTKPSPPGQLDEAASSPLGQQPPPGPISLPATPWYPLVPEADARGLTSHKRVFLAQSLMLRRAPSHARSLAFQSAVAVWYAEANQDNVAQKNLDSDPALQEKWDSVNLSSSSSASRRKTLHKPAATARQSDTESLSENLVADPLNPPSNKTGRTNDTTEIALGRRPLSSSTFTRDSEQTGKQPPAEFPEEPALYLDPHELSRETAAKSAGASLLAMQARRLVSSDLAGVFFLINVALWLGLYSDFTAPLGENLELDLWDLLCLLAARYVGDDLGTEHLNTLLAELAGRATSEPAGINFRPPPVWEIPATWLRGFPEPFTDFTRKQTPEPEAGPAELLQSWADWITAYIRARLVLALGRDDAAEFLCRVSGSVEITPMRIDIHYSLQTHPIEIRLVGLDRDPGWIPAAGRYVAYHFY